MATSHAAIASASNASTTSARVRTDIGSNGIVKLNSILPVWVPGRRPTVFVHDSPLRSARFEAE